MPNIAKKINMMPMLAAVNRGFLKKLARRASGGRCGSPRRRTPASSAMPRTNATRIVLFGPALLRRLDDPVEQRRRARRSRAPRRWGRAAAPIGSFDVGMRKKPARSPIDDDRDVHEEDRAPVEVLEQEAAGDRAEHAGEPGRACPDADRLAALARREDVGDDRQRRRHDERAADAHERARRDELVGAARERRERASRARTPPARPAARPDARTGRPGCRR